MLSTCVHWRDFDYHPTDEICRKDRKSVREYESEIEGERLNEREIERG
jgi:hypothetical protein